MTRCFNELVDVLQTGSGSSPALQFLAGEVSPEMAGDLPDLWHKDIAHFSDAIRDRVSPRPCSKRERTRPSPISARQSTRSHPTSATEQAGTTQRCQARDGSRRSYTTESDFLGVR